MQGLELRVYGKSGGLLKGWVVNPISTAFSDEFNGTGTGEVTVLLDSPDADLLERDNVVRVFWRGRCLFAWFVEQADRTIATSSEQRVVKLSGRGLLGWLDDAVVYPQAGFAGYAATDRMFNFASADGYWMNNTNYAAPKGVAWKADTTVRKGQPKKWPNPAAMWIWSTDPTAKVARGETNWFRTTFTLDADEKVRFQLTADNRYEVFLDGAPLLTSTSSRTQSVSWSEMGTKTLRVPKGTHTLAARVQNEKPFEAEGVSIQVGEKKEDEETGNAEVQLSGISAGVELVISNVDGESKSGLSGGTYWSVNVDKDFFCISKSKGGAPVKIKEGTRADIRIVDDTTAGFLLTASALDDKGRSKKVITATDTTTWKVATVEPEWEPAEILWALIMEARARGVSRLDALRKGWDQATDSDGAKWTRRVDATFPVGTGLLSVMDYGVNLGIDYWVSPSDLTVKAAETRGSDKSKAVALRLGHNLISFSTTEERTLKTAALVRTKDGWTEKRWMADTYGRRETMVTVERTRSNETGRKVAQRRLESIGRRTVVAQTADLVPVPGCVPYFDFTVGDIVSVPNPYGKVTPYRARVLSISMTSQGEDPRYSLELEVLGID